MAKLTTQIYRHETIRHKDGKEVVIKHATLADLHCRYTGEKLRELRKKRGVGRPPAR